MENQSKPYKPTDMSSPSCVPLPEKEEDDEAALNEFIRLFGNDEVMDLPAVAQPEGLPDGFGDTSLIRTALSHQLKPSPFQTLPDPAVLQELSAEASRATSTHLHVMQPARTSDLTLKSTGRVTKGKRGSGCKGSKSFRKLSLEVCLLGPSVHHWSTPTPTPTPTNKQQQSFADRTAAKMLSSYRSDGMVSPVGSAPPGSMGTPFSQDSTYMQLGNENVQLRRRLNAAMMEVELLRDVVGRLMEVRGPTRVPTMQTARQATRQQQANYMLQHLQQQIQQS